MKTAYTMPYFNRFLGIFVLICAVGLGGCSSLKDPKWSYKADRKNTPYNTDKIIDPIEPVNRAIFAFNDGLDTVIIGPIAKAYKAVVPSIVRNGIQNFMRNLKTPYYAVNNALQGDLGGAGTSLARFVVNTTVGVGGVADVAANHGLAYEQEDFGQTLAVWGFGSGPYMVLPIVGPSSLRDTAGLAVDIATDPVNRYAENADHEWIMYTRTGLEGLDTRSRLIEAIDDLRKNSIDYYAAVRSVYGQKRASLVRDESVENGGYAVPEYDEDPQ